VVSTRPPDGEPICCPLCGFPVEVPPERPPDNVPCPKCGCPVWLGDRKRPIDRKVVETTKRQIRELVDRLAVASKTEEDPARYIPELLGTCVCCLAAPGGAFWTRSRGKWAMKFSVGVPNADISEKQLSARAHINLLERAFASEEALVWPPIEASPEEPVGVDPTNTLLLLWSIVCESERTAVVEIFQRTGTLMST